jgi:hypothetical protein
MNRRTLLRLGGLTAATALAGCTDLFETLFFVIYVFLRLNTSIRQLEAELDVSYRTLRRRVEQFVWWKLEPRLGRNRWWNHFPRHIDRQGVVTRLGMGRSLRDIGMVRIVSGILDRPVRTQTVVLGAMSLMGELVAVSSLVDKLQLAVDSGAKTVLLPAKNEEDLAKIPDELLDQLQLVFYTDPLDGASKAIELE